MKLLEERLGHKPAPEEVKYDCKLIGEEFQCMLSVFCFGGEVFHGSGKSIEEAQQKATAVALEELRKPPQTGGLGVDPAAGNAVKTMQPPANSVKAVQPTWAALAKQAPVDAKSTLQIAVARSLAPTSLQKSDITYQTEQCEGGFQSTCNLGVLGLEKGAEVAGEVKKAKKEAEQSAALYALIEFKDVLKLSDDMWQQVVAQSSGAPVPQPGSKKQEMCPCLALTADGPVMVMLSAATIKAATPVVKGSETERMLQQLQLGEINPSEFPSTFTPVKKEWQKPAAPLLQPPKTRTPDISMSNGKTRLVNFLAKKLRRTLTKEDMTYDVIPVEGGYQANLTLGCFDGEVFVGDVGKDIKSAEMKAAEQAMERHAEEEAALLTEPNGKRKKPSGMVAGDGALALTAAKDPKCELMEFLQKLLGKPMAKGDVKYESIQYPEGWQSTVTVKDMVNEEVVGEVGPSQKEAERLAAAMALQLYTERAPELMEQRGKRRK